MASISTDLKIMNLAYGEEGAYGYTNYGDLYDANLSILESALTGQSAITVTTANVTLSDAQQQSLHLNLSGLLTGNRSILLGDDQKGLWFVTNGTTGAYTITIKPTSGSGFVLDQGKRAWVYCDGTTAFPIVRIGDLLSQEVVSSDADFTLTWNSNADTVRHTGTLTADRAVTLATAGATKGARWRVTRTGSGNFNLNIGTGPLAALGQNMWGEFVYDGSAWYLDKHGVLTTSAFAQTILDDADAAAVRTTIGAQTSDDTLTALAAFNTNGLLVQTAADTFAGRTLTGTANQITVTNGNGGSGDPTLSLPADVIIPTIITAPNTGLHVLDTNASHDLIIKPGSDLTADRTLTLTTGDANRTLTLNSDVNISSFIAGLLDDTDQSAAQATLGITSGGAMEFVASATASASAALVFNTGFSSAYDEYIFIVESVYPATTQNFNFQVSVDGGSSYLSTGYRWRLWDGTTSVTGTNSNSDSSSRLVTSAAGGSASDAISGYVRLLVQSSTEMTTQSFLQSSGPDKLSIAGSRHGSTGTRVNACRFLAASGNLTAGTIRMYRVKNS